MQFTTSIALALCLLFSTVVCVPYNDLSIPSECRDNPFFASCSLIVQSKFCNHDYYSQFCCKSCAMAGQLDPIRRLRDSATDDFIRNI